MDTTTTRPEMTVKQFVAENANLSALPIIKEARRIVKLARKQRLTTTENSVAQIIYTLRKTPAAANGLNGFTGGSQAVETAAELTAMVASGELSEAARKVLDLDPREVHFSHDHSVWHRGE